MRQGREEKEAKYILLISQLRQVYRGFKFEIIPILTGALGSIPHELKTNLQRLGIQKNKDNSTERQNTENRTARHSEDMQDHTKYVEL